MLVTKFGGTSVGDAQRIAHVADLIVATRRERPEMVVVVSAMAGVTNALFALARTAATGDATAVARHLDALRIRHLEAAAALLHGGAELGPVQEAITAQVGELDRICRSVSILGEATVRTLDLVAGAGERLSSRLLAAALRSRGCAAEAVSATELIVTDARFGNAEPDLEASKPRVRARLGALLERGAVPVVTGYIGATREGIPTTLGRGGSDFSAAILGACLEAEEVWIWSDVDGILTGDPNIVPEARTLTELSYADAATLAALGAEVLHPKTVAPLVDRAIPLRLLNTFHPERPGTLIVSQPKSERPRPPAIISTTGLLLLGVVGNGARWSPGIAGRALSALAGAGVEVLMFSQSFSDRTLALLVRQAEREASLRALQREFQDDLQNGAVAQIRPPAPVGTISVVAAPGGQGAPVVPRTFAALGKLEAQIVSVAQSASEYHVSVVVPEEQVEAAVCFIHRELHGAT
ncbi:MAG: aspartate kinase [Anaerolineae bacterium]